MNLRLLLTATGGILIGVYLLAALRFGWNGAAQSFLVCASGRVGLVALAAALAWPQIVPLTRRFPVWLWGMLGFAMLLVAFRPKLIFVAAGLVLAAIAIHGGLGWLNRSLFRKD
jgi:hypothetical protein